jgi:hypothetical protein
MTLALWIIGGVLGAGGFALASWALFGDRSRARRCRRCWYSMEGVPGLVCPECGREATSERVLTRRRRRWRAVAIGLVTLLAGAGALGYNLSIQPNGVWSLMPNRMVVWMYVHTGIHDAGAELAGRQVARMAPGLRASFLMGAMKRIAASATEDEYGRAGYEWMETQSELAHLIPWVQFNDVIASDAKNVIECTSTLLVSNDPRDHAAVFYFLIQVEFPSERQLFMSNVAPALATGGSPAIVSRTIFDRSTAELVVHRVLEGRTAVSLTYALRFVAALPEFDEAWFERVVNAAMVTEDPHDVAAEASRLLEGIGKPGRNSLGAALSHPHELRRYYALVSLGSMGTKAADQKARIKAILDDPQPSVAAAAVWAAKRVSGELDQLARPPAYRLHADEPLLTRSDWRDRSLLFGGRPEGADK